MRRIQYYTSDLLLLLLLLLHVRTTVLIPLHLFTFEVRKLLVKVAPSNFSLGLFFSFLRVPHPLAFHSTLLSHLAALGKDSEHATLVIAASRRIVEYKIKDASSLL